MSGLITWRVAVRFAVAIFMLAIVGTGFLAWRVMNAGLTLESAAFRNDFIAVDAHLRFLGPSRAEIDHALQTAVFYDSVESARRILQCELPEATLVNALLMAASSGRYEVAEEILERGTIDPNTRGRIFTMNPPLPILPVDAAAEVGQRDVVTLLREHGAEYEIHHAVMLNDISGVERFLSENPELARATNYTGKSPLALAVEIQAPEIERALQAALERNDEKSPQ